MNTKLVGGVGLREPLCADGTPAGVPGFVRAAVARCEARGYTIAFGRPDFAGQRQIAVRSPAGDAFTWHIVGNAYERDVSYLTFVERLECGPRGRKGARMQSAQEGSCSLLGAPMRSIQEGSWSLLGKVAGGL